MKRINTNGYECDTHIDVDKNMVKRLYFSCYGNDYKGETYMLTESGLYYNFYDRKADYELIIRINANMKRYLEGVKINELVSYNDIKRKILELAERFKEDLKKKVENLETTTNDKDIEKAERKYEYLEIEAKKIKMKAEGKTLEVYITLDGETVEIFEDINVSDLSSCVIYDCTALGDYYLEFVDYNEYDERLGKKAILHEAVDTILNVVSHLTQ